MADLNERMWNLTLQLLKTFYLHYHTVYGHQTWQRDDLALQLPPRKAYDPLIS